MASKLLKETGEAVLKETTEFILLDGVASPSASLSPSSSVSPSLAYPSYTRGNYASLPADDADLETTYSAQDYTDVESDNNVRVDQEADGEYAIHQYKNVIEENGKTFTWNGQSDYPPSSSAVVLQIYNRDTPEWETLDTDNSTGADTDFDLSGAVADLTNYKDTNNVVSCRVYQRAI